jgi:hypothetical protein
MKAAPETAQAFATEIREGRVAFFASSVHGRGVAMGRSGHSRAVENAHPAAFPAGSLCESELKFSGLI